MLTKPNDMIAVTSYFRSYGFSVMMVHIPLLERTTAMDKRTTAAEAVSHIQDGCRLMVGGFLQGGSPETLIAALLNTQAKNLHIISNDTGTADTHTIQLMRQGRVSRVTASYIGANPETIRMRLEDPESVELNPQGTFAERIRAGGAGIPAFLTPTGVGTIVEEGKRKLELDGREYLLETALHADVALVHAAIADTYGNCFMRGSSKNFNAIMPAAAEYCIVEVEQIVEVGELDPELVTVSGIFVDAVVKAGE